MLISVHVSHSSAAYMYVYIVYSLDPWYIDASSQNSTSHIMTRRVLLLPPTGSPQP